MKTRKSGKRHPLVLYRRSFDRLWKVCLPIGGALIVTQTFFGKIWPFIGYVPPLPPLLDELLFFGGLLLLAITLYGLFARNLAYAQARPDHLRISTPFTQIKVSYRRIRIVHPSSLSSAFPSSNLKGSLRSFLAPYLSETVLIVELTGLPLARIALKFFLGPAMLLPSTPGLVLLVPDWMSLSTEIDSILSTWRQNSSAARAAADPAGNLLRNLRN